MTPRVFVITTERYLWALKGFSYLFCTYWSTLQDVVVIGDVRPRFALPPSFSFVSVSHKALPKNRWSDGIVRFLNGISDPSFVLLLEDYWLTRTVDLGAIPTLAEYMASRPEILRIDLTADRLYAGGMKEVGSYGHYDLIETPPDSPYQMSLQAAIWNRERFLEIVRPGLSPWEVELVLSPELHGRNDLRVLGTRQWPVRYANVLQGGNSDELQNLDQIPDEHRRRLGELGWLSRT